ncbi:MAG: hypothetical protein IPM52_03420 [Bacteroidetes bacterium]|nr:hypothetical protein [Bacteroidota bacterium]
MYSDNSYYQNNRSPRARPDPISIFITLMLAIPLWIGVLSPLKPLEKEEWLPPIDPRADGKVPVKRLKKKGSTLYLDDYRKYRGTSKWDEFMEEIEQKGLDPWDPEAKEIWSTYYH